MPSEDTHPEFLALCALAASGSLNASDERRLREHLSQCPSCRKAMAQYQVLIHKIVPAMAPDNPEESDGAPPWSLEEAEAALFQRLEEEDPESPRFEEESPADPSVDSKQTEGERVWRHMWFQYAAGLVLLAALGFAVYWQGIRRGIEAAGQNLPGHTTVPASDVSHPDNNRASTAPEHAVVDQKDAQLDALRHQLEQQDQEIAQLKAHQAQIEDDLSAKGADADRLSRERADLAQQLSAVQTSLQDAQQKLTASTNQGSENAIQVAALEAQVTELTTALHQRDQEVAREQELLDHDRDIRDLMGARDLHISDVYDVAQNGDTEKPFGRVFYTRGKSLIFYAYDLDQRPGFKNVSTFQVWGRRGPERERAINLGILYQDNTNKKRWVLKSHDPKSLAEIDAVFVTMEPDGGSQHPSSKPLLFGYLRNEPNHP